MCPLCFRSFNTIKQLQFHAIDRHGSMLSGTGELQKVEMDHDVLKSSQGMHILSNAMSRTTKAASAEAQVNLGIEPPSDPFTTTGYTSSPHRTAEPEQQKSFSCPFCPKSFRIKDALEVHISVAHKSTESENEKKVEKQARSSSPTSAKSFADLMRESTQRKEVPKQEPATEKGSVNQKVSENLSSHERRIDMYSLPPYSGSAKYFQETYVSAACNSLSIFTGFCVSELRFGYFFKAKVTEFTLALDSPYKDTKDLRSKNKLTIRCFEGNSEYASKHITSVLSDYGGRILVIGTHKLLPEVDAEFNVVHNYPVIHVSPPVGVIYLLE